MGLFGKTTGGGAKGETTRAQRHSSGWAELSKLITARPSLRVLDIGPTSSANINLITSLGHSIYMANLVEEANRPEWLTQTAENTKDSPSYDVDRFVSQNMDFAGRRFDVVLLWDTLDYVPDALAQPIVNRLASVLDEDGHLLAMFHGKLGADEGTFSRYHLVDAPMLEVQRAGGFPLLHTYSNRQVETMFKEFASHKFFLAKDTLREVLLRR